MNFFFLMTHIISLYEYIPGGILQLIQKYINLGNKSQQK